MLKPAYTELVDEYLFEPESAPLGTSTALSNELAEQSQDHDNRLR
jgi:hypothetical protein